MMQKTLKSFHIDVHQLRQNDTGEATLKHLLQAGKSMGRSENTTHLCTNPLPAHIANSISMLLDGMQCLGMNPELKGVLNRPQHPQAISPKRCSGLPMVRKPGSQILPTST